MATACLLVTGMAIYLLYHTSIEEQGERLRVLAQSQARLIEAIARYDRLHGIAYPGGPAKATLTQITDAHGRYPGFGKTGEFTLARREGNSIVFLLRHRHTTLENPKTIPLDSRFAEPMRRALAGKSGTIIGKDYRGETVLAAYEPVKTLNFGIVAKMDLAEIKSPFIRAGLIAICCTFIVVFGGAALFLRISDPIIRSLERRTVGLKKAYEEINLALEEREKASGELKRLASIVESSDDAIIGKTLDGVITSWNKGAENLYGYSEEEMKGKPVSMLLPPGRSDNLPQRMQKIRGGERIDHYETVRQRKDGTLVDISLSIFPIKDDKGEIVAASTIARDISAHKLADEKIQKSEQQLSDLIENSLTGISIIQDNTVVYQNLEQERLLGPLPRPAKLSDHESIHPDDIEKVSNFYLALATGKESRFETDFRFFVSYKKGRKDRMKWVHCRASLVDYQGKGAVLVNMMDITRTKELEQLLRIEDKMSSLGRVSAGIAHEIRNPLSGINIYLKTLEKIFDRGEGLDKVKGIIGELQSASRKIESVIRRVMDFAKPAEPKLLLTDMNQPIEEAVRLTAVAMRKRGIQFERVSAEALPPCRLDPQMIEQVIVNLINNAADAMKNMDGAKKIQVATSVSDDHVVLKVSDSGLGVPPHLRDKVFDPFYTTKNGSSGIGLSLGRRIITDHGGYFEVSESRLGGAEFIIGIPFEKGLASK
jgi:PAS domain S-box-containing protein